ncbi:MAG: hypothetical protein AABW79_03165 [Nanoarchaeota archaeon]
MQKRGLNAIITTVLILLIVIIAITLLWTILSPSISNASEEVGATASCFSLVLEPKSCRYDADSELVNVRVERRSGTSTIEGLNFIFSDNTRKSVNSSNTASLNELESKTFTFDSSELGGITFPPAWFTISGIIDPKVRSCDEVRPPIACLQAICGDGIVDSFLGETCDETECCDSCNRIATCDGIDNNENNLTDEEGETFPANFRVSISEPIEGRQYDTSTSTYNNLALRFSVLNISNPQQTAIDLKSCWYRLDGQTNILVLGCMTLGGGASQVYSLNLTPLSPGSHIVTVFANDSLNRVSSRTVSFTVAQVTLALASPATYPPEIMRSTGVEIRFSTTLQNLSRCYYTLNGGQTNVTIPACQQGATFSVSEGWHNFILYINNTLFEVSNSESFLATPCRVDANGDGVHSFSDLSSDLLGNWGCTGTPGGECEAMINNSNVLAGDLNRDGEVENLDVEIYRRYAPSC